MFSSVVGHSEDIDTPDAVREVIRLCKEKLAGKPASAGFVFSYIHHELASIGPQICAAFPGIHLIGATTDGELSSDLPFSDTSLVLQILSSDDVGIASSVARNVSTNTAESIRIAAQEALQQLNAPPALCVMFPDSLTVSGTRVVESMRSAFGECFPIFGGTAGDFRLVQKTYQFYHDELLNDSVPMLVFSEPIHFSFGRVSGWKPLSAEGRISRAQGPVVFEIDGQPAVNFLSRYLGELHQDPGFYAEYPFLIKEAQGSYQICIMEIDPDQGSIIFFGEIPEGSIVRIAEADRDMIVAASAESVKEAVRNYGVGKPGAALALTCASRKAILGTRTVEEGQLMQEVLNDIPFSGFYTYGEIAPSTPGSATYFNNEMFITLLLGTP
jgi:hypothetical protein